MRGGCRWFNGVAAVGSTLALFACQQQTDDRPPLIAACSGSSCLTPTVSAGSTSASDAGSDAATTPSGPITLTGRVLWFADERFSGATSYPAPATITAEAQAGGTVSTTFDGMDDFSLPGVLAGPSVWVSAAPDSSADAVTTLIPVPTQSATDVSIPLVRPSSLALVFSVLSQPTSLDAARGDIVLFVTSAATGQALQGVTVTSTDAETVAYATATSWSDAVDITGPLGVVVLGNVDAASLPGSFVTVQFSGAASGSMSIRVAANAATVVRVGL